VFTIDVFSMLTLNNGLRALLISDRDEPSSDDLSNPYDEAMNISDTGALGDRNASSGATDSGESEQSPFMVIYSTLCL